MTLQFHYGGKTCPKEYPATSHRIVAIVHGESSNSCSHATEQRIRQLLFGHTLTGPIKKRRDDGSMAIIIRAGTTMSFDEVATLKMHYYDMDDFDFSETQFREQYHIIRGENLSDATIEAMDTHLQRVRSNAGDVWFEIDGISPDGHSTHSAFLAFSMQEARLLSEFLSSLFAGKIPPGDTQSMEKSRRKGTPKMPNKAPEPTITLGTSAAEPPRVPSAIVAHL